jgi:DNA-binding GntR family transcriptional regulator
MSLTSEAFERIREAIVSGALEFGEQLSEVQIADALGISKAPVRAAFIELRDMGLVNIVPQAGTYVCSPTAQDVRTMTEFRAMLELEALSQAMKRDAVVVVTGMRDAIGAMSRAIEAKNWNAYRSADSAFHMVIMKQSGNRYLPKAYNLTASVLEALRVRLQSGTGNFRWQSYEEHKSILAFLENGDVASASDLLRHHILVINDSLDTLPSLLPTGRGDRATDRDFTAIFQRQRPPESAPSRFMQT